MIEPQLIVPVGRDTVAEVLIRGPKVTRESVQMLIRILELSLDAFPSEQAVDEPQGEKP